MLKVLLLAWKENGPEVDRLKKLKMQGIQPAVLLSDRKNTNWAIKAAIIRPQESFVTAWYLFANAKQFSDSTPFIDLSEDDI